MTANGFTSGCPHEKAWPLTLTCLTLILLLVSVRASSQELYVFSEPASNMPARALSLKYSGKFLQGAMSGNPEQRQKLYVSAGLDKKWMLRMGTTVSDMYSYPKTRWESVSLLTCPF